jgi:MarR family transcriptional regulator, organic hydroperoxide resistance regulator
MATRDDSSVSSTLALEALKLFRIIFKSANRHFHDIEKTAGIGGASLWSLAEISESVQLTVSGLAKAMSIHQSTASNLMEKLESSGYVIRTRSMSDRRLVHLSLTDKGREILAKAPPPYRGILPDALMRLDPDILNALNRHLTELISVMERKVDDGAYEPLGKS